MVKKTSSPITQAIATRFFKAAKAAGFERARLITHPDGRVEIIGEDGTEPVIDRELSPFEKWEAENANKT